MTRTRLGVWRWTATLLVAYILARPVSTNQVLVPVLAAMGALAAATIIVRRRRIAIALVPAFFMTFAFGLIGLAVDSNNPGFMGGALVFIAAPLLYWMVALSVDERMLRATLRAAAVVTVFIGITISLYVAAETGSAPDILPSWLLEQYGAGFGGVEYTEVRYYGLSTLIATGPMWAASLFVGRDALLPPPWLRVAATTAATVATLSAGRRALALVLVLAPLLTWLIKLVVRHRKTERTRARTPVVLGGLAALVLLVSLSPGTHSDRVIAAAWRSLFSYATGSDFVGANAAEDEIRSYQADRLLGEWAEAPILGHGLGATIQGYSRSAEEPWRWELQFHALLFQTGLLGAFLLLLGTAFTVNAFVLAARARPDRTPSLIVACTGAAAMLIGNISNPYLQAPGHVWAIFLPVAVANVMLLSRSSESRDRSSPSGAVPGDSAVPQDPSPFGRDPLPT